MALGEMAGAISPKAVAVMEGEMKAMLMTTPKVAITVLVALNLMGAGLGLAYSQTVGFGQGGQGQPPVAQEKPDKALPADQQTTPRKATPEEKQEAENIARWQEKPFFARRLGQKVPPAAFYATTTPMPEGAVVKIKVVECPKNAKLRIHDFIGGPVFSTGFKEFTDLTAGQDLTYKLNKKKTLGITTVVDKENGTCAGLEHKDGYDVLKYSFGNLGNVIIEVKVADK